MVDEPRNSNVDAAMASGAEATDSRGRGGGGICGHNVRKARIALNSTIPI